MSNIETRKKEKLIAKALAVTVGGTALLFGGVKLQEVRNPYGYDPARNPAAPTYLQTHNGVNPADIVHSPDK